MIEELNNSKPNYLAAYGLTEAPFSQQHDDHFLYLNTALTKRLELINHYIQYSNLLLILTGERGIGKSSLKQRFINTAAEEWQICEIQARTTMDADLLLRQIATGLGVIDPPLESSLIFEDLSNQLEQLYQESYVPILIIDDAHELPQDALQALLYLAENHTDQQTALRIILFCEPEIDTMLEDPALLSLKERVTHYMEIPLLDETQTAEYLRHRLAVAGLDSASPFTPVLVSKIFKASEGLPSKINEFAHQNLIDDSEPALSVEKINIDDELYQTRIFPDNLRNILLSGFALICVVSVLFFYNRINTLFNEPKHVIAKIKPNQNTNLPPQAPTENINNPQNSNNTSNIQLTKEKTIEFNINKPPSKKIIPQKKSTIDTNKDTSTITLSAIYPSSVPANNKNQIISISGSGFHKRQKVKVSWGDKEKILTAKQVNLGSDTYINLILNVGMRPDTWTVTIIDPLLNIESNTINFEVTSHVNKIVSKQKKFPGKVAETKIKTKFHSNLILHEENWIKRQNKNHFTLQLLGTHQKASVSKFLKKFSLKNDAATFKTIRNGKDWFTLIYGVYSTKSAAQTATKQLPKGVSKPWVRSFASIFPSINSKNTSNLAPFDPVSTKQKNWLWSQNPNNFTLQLAAGTDKNAIQALITKHNLSGKAVYFHRRRDGKDWYILIHGSYSDSSKAKQAIHQLPLAVQKSKPWARKFNAIHGELN